MQQPECEHALSIEIGTCALVKSVSAVTSLFHLKVADCFLIFCWSDIL